MNITQKRITELTGLPTRNQQSWINKKGWRRTAVRLFKKEAERLDSFDNYGMDTGELLLLSVREMKKIIAESKKASVTEESLLNDIKINSQVFITTR